MTEHALDAMLYAWRVMKEKEENKMEGIFLGKVDQTAFDPRCISLSFGTKHLDQHVEVRKELDYDCDYMLVKADDVIKTNDELLKLRDEVKQWDDECSEWKKLYAKVNNELFQKGLAYGTLETAYKNEKIAGEMLLKDRDALKEKVEKLEAELTEIKTARTLREAYIAGVEKGFESLRGERDLWKRRWNSVVTDISKSLAANGVEFKLKENDGEATWVFVIDIPELNEAKKKIAELETKVKVAESKESYWRDRKEEEEDHHHYWLHTFNRVVKLAADIGVNINVCGMDKEYNVGIIVVDNAKAAELKSQVTTLTDSNKKLNQQVLQLEKDYQNLNQKYGAADNALEYWNNTYNDIVIAGKKVGVKIDIRGKRSDSNAGFVYVTNEKVEALERQIKRLEEDNSADKNRGDHWKRNYEDLAEYWDNTCKDLVATGKKVGVKIEFKGDKSDSNTGNFDITNEKAIELMVNVSDTKHEYNKKWQAMLNALKAKGIEVIYMGEQDSKPIIDVKVPKLDELQKDFEDLNVKYINRGSKIECLELDLRDSKNKDNKYEKLFIEATNMKDYWYSTYYEAVRQSWNQGVSIRIDRANLKDNVGIVQVNNERAEELKKELEDLKSKKISTCSLEAGADGVLKFIYTYMDGHNEAAHINCLCKNYVAIDAENISCGTVPKCKSCAHYMHKGDPFAGRWCYKAVHKEGPKFIRRLSTEEAEGPACSDFEARKE